VLAVSDSAAPAPASEPSIAIAASMADYFRDIVDDAVRAKKVEASAAAQCYLVQLLSDFGRPDEELDEAMKESPTLLLHEAISAAEGKERFRRLRNLGDGTLYGLGFFGEHVEGRGVDRGYVAHVGSAAYDHAATMLRVSRGGGPIPDGHPDVLAELSRKFREFVEVLAYVADGAMAQSARGAQGIVKLYERWLRTGSSALASGLAERGLLPVRGGGSA
jgi:hypothetical protein